MNAGTQRLSVAGPAGSLECAVDSPAAEAPGVVVVCHPHPLHGGTMDNKVVHTLARAMQEMGAPTLRFNFRGTGASAGSYDEGRGEVDDLIAVAAFARVRWPQAELWLAGFSFGAWVALQAESRLTPAKLITVAPPVGRFADGSVGTPRSPWLLVQGDADEVVESADVLAWARSLTPGPELALLPGAGHFFHGRLHELKDRLLPFLAA